jgi:hypothetical protein
MQTPRFAKMRPSNSPIRPKVRLLALLFPLLSRSTPSLKSEYHDLPADIRDPIASKKRQSFASASDADDEQDNDDDDDEEQQQQARYLHTHIWKNLYPPTSGAKYVPTRYFGQSDCEVLAAVESKHRASKWLEMQANFYNVTGRLLPLDVIRAKCERAEGRIAGAGAGRIEAWIDNLQHD